MTLIEAYNNIKKNYPNLVEYLIKRSLKESESERQTIYGDLSDWIRDYYSDLSLPNKDMLAKLILGDYVIKKGSFSTKVYALTQESNIDGEIYFCVNLFYSYEDAKKAMDEEIDWIVNESHHFKSDSLEQMKEDFYVEYNDYRFFVDDESDDYYEQLKIEEKVIH